MSAAAEATAVPAATSVSFNEEMKGFVSFGATDFRPGYLSGRVANTPCRCALIITIADIDSFVRDPEGAAAAGGFVDCPALGGQGPIESGVFNLLIDVIPQRHTVKDMRYRLFFRTPTGRPMTLVGTKFVDNDGIFHLWRDTTTLFKRLFDGHVRRGEEAGATLAATGILHLTPLEFATQLLSFRAGAPSFAARAGAVFRFVRFFAGRVWQVYGLKLRR